MATTLTNTLTPQVQQWLHQVIRHEYIDPHNTYHNVAATLYQFPTLSPRTDVYTHEDGRPQLLLHLSGTLPVVFRGATYNIPLTIWLPHEYPKKPPMVFVTPAKDMLIRPGNHVDPSGRCYHPYLANWVNYSDRSTIVDLLDILRQVFGREPPVYAKQQDTPPSQPRNEVPPPLPPLPPEFGKSNSPVGRLAQPPALPPPLPPLPSELMGSRGPPAQSYMNNPVYQQFSPSGGRFPGGLTPPMRPASFSAFPPPLPPPTLIHPQSHPMIPRPPQTLQSPPPPPPPHPPPPPPPPPPKRESIDIMNKTPPPILSAAPPPPPRNPEKDRLLQEISRALHTRAEAAHAKTRASLEQAAAQCEAILKAESNMERECAELGRIVELCDKDAEILRERISMAGEVIRDAESREVPGVDVVVVAPTVVHTQLYDLVTEDMAIEDTIYVLGKALDRERIPLDVFLKHTRTLAREQFLLRALVKKITRQIGIES